MTKSHTVQYPVIPPPPIFFLRTITTTVIFGSQKGPHPERWYLCFGENISSWSNDTPSCSHVPGCGLILVNILFSYLRRMDPHPSLTVTLRMVLAILASSQNFGLRKPKFWQRSSHLKVSKSRDSSLLCSLRLDKSKAHSFLSIIFKERILTIRRFGRHHCLSWDRSDAFFKQTSLFHIIELIYRSIIGTQTGVIIVIFALFWYLHGQHALRTADFEFITH